jgi:metal-sulfur cluster biosynthetic enzyme
MLTRDLVLKTLKGVYDPEIPVNLVDLGLIYDVKIEESVVSIKMTLTATGCPMHELISNNVKDALEALESVSEVQIEIVWEPRWNPEMISPEGRIALGMA